MSFTVLAGMSCVSGCGRIGYLAVEASIDASSDAALGGGPDASEDAAGLDATPDARSYGVLFADDFNDGDISDWTVLDPPWTTDTSGSDGSSVLLVPSPDGSTSITHPRLRGLYVTRVALRFRIDGATLGDFNVWLFPSPFSGAMPDMSDRYSIGIHPVGSDTPTDYVAAEVGTETLLASRPDTIFAGDWHDLVVDIGDDGSFRVTLDGDSSYMTTGPDATLSPPFDVALRFYDNGAIDDLVVSGRL